MSDNGILLPERPLSKLENVAQEEHRSVKDVLCDAIEQYAGVWSWTKLLSYSQDKAKALGLIEGDVDRLIAEYRAEHARS